MEQGLLPNFKKLAEAGCYRRLRTTFPSVSPVAWSSFSTGTQPGRHNIFDFLDRDRRTYLPVLSSAHLGTRRAVHQAGTLPDTPRSGPSCACCASRSRSGPCSASIASGARFCASRSRFRPIGSTERELSAMSVPDLLGTQGTFLLFTTRPAGERFKEGGTRIAVTIQSDRIDTAVQGPENPFAADSRPLEVPIAHRARSVPAAGGGRRRRHAGHAHTGTAQRLGHAAVPGGAGHRGLGDYAPARDRDGRPLLAVHVAHQHRSREAGDAGVSPALLLDVPGETDRPLRDARPCRGHLGAQ